MQLYIDKINKIIKEKNKGKDRIAVLEAGCGSGSRFVFGPNAYITGVDISLKQLQKNNILHNKILADIQTLSFQPSSFDVIICWEVLEHVQKPRQVLENFYQVLRESGIIIIAIPNLMSLKGLVTKFTPHKFHFWCNKFIFGWQMPTFPTYCKIFISPIFLKRFLKFSNSKILWSHFSNGWTKNLKRRSLIFYNIYIVLGIIIKILTFGIINIRNTDFIIVYQKA